MNEEIKKQYANEIVNADEVIKSLIDKFKTDKTSVDIQQLQLIAEYLLYRVDKLQKDNYKLDRENQHFFDRIQDLQKENDELSQANMSLLEINQKLIEEKPMIKELTDKYYSVLEYNAKLESEVKKWQQ